ncbi:glucose-1-phosphate adenylyltransferase [Aliifodinibius salipaludis]|uniref:Glucose-1-phosphate adenylyltransferase n=1 Tax=Fodinibius salipaludis TaxID=2032627 RepID=A0A2A2GFW2_9BACT|nr:glucose-1-phosphate adenylyltransferase [Aliifodinibius salipaludis]PAU95779.1 glucose-1-phosphate adenylyltransferase [Aliifodinibius salipaludis]
MRRKVIAVILGGGQGTRLFPLTKMRSKPAVPVAGKYRLVDIPISNCINSGVRRIYVLTQFNSASLNRHIKNSYNFDVFSRGFVDILAAEQTPESKNWYQGTADAVRQSIHHMENHSHEHVLILSGDQLYQMDYRKMMKKHEDNDADITIGTIPVVAEDATGFGIMKTNKEGFIESFVEKPDYDDLDQWKSETPEKFKKDGRVYLASMGIYIFKKDILNDLFAEYEDATDFGKEIIPEAIKEDYQVQSYEFDGYWTDIGTIKSFFEANLALTDDLPQFNLYDNEDFIYTHARMLPASKLSGTTFDHSVLAEGCLVEASRIERSIIGIRSRVGKGTTIEHSIIMGNDFFQSQEEIEQSTDDNPPMGIGQRCFISNAIIDKNVKIGDDVRIAGGDHLEDGEYEHYHVVDGIVIIPKGEIIEDGTKI